ncbi:hypothetical protein WJX73_007086 [Symbiochloris irregularis]|uniref:Galactose oxidase-like Early set domain-containing protein n=1 Tax=Symbiochloris irregularis TaxID=706552 RepID=A0AAW1NML1_9CHLO
MLTLAAFTTISGLLGFVGGQSGGPGFRNGNPVSAKLTQIDNMDPFGLTALLDGLGFPAAYLGKWPVEYPPELVAADPSYDPAVRNPINGNNAAVNGSFRVVGNTGIPTAHATPFANDLIIFLIRPNLQLNAGFDTHLQRYGAPQNYTQVGDSALTSTIYNMTDNTFEPFYIKEMAFCGANTLLPDGRAIIAGGNWGTDSSPSSSQPNTAVNCAANQGGGFSDPHQNNPTYQVYYPGNNTLSPALALTILLESWPVNTYPFAVVLPTGSTLVIAGAQIQALFLNYDEAVEDEEVGEFPELPYPVTYPAYGSYVLLPLQGPDYKAEILIAGGSSDYCANAKSLASKKSILFDASAQANHTLIEEEITYARVMPDLVILPDGRLFLSNGAGVGIAGGTGPNYAAADQGVTIAEIYDPSKPLGGRWTPVADSQIWRMYHSISFITKNAEVFISGSETTGEFRAQLWTPDYLQNGKPRPSISGAPSIVGYGQAFSFQYSNVSTLDRVVFQRSTHGNHMDQRQVVLDCTFSTRQADCTSPPNANIAPPGIYYLFALYDGVPGVAEYVSVGTTEPSPSMVAG